MKIKKKIAFLGAGNMAEALIRGLVESGLVSKRDIYASDVREKRLKYIKSKYKVNISGSNKETVKKCSIIFICVKPQNMKELLDEISSLINASQLVISIAAGVSAGKIEKYLAKGTPVIRSMPNTPALLGLGAIAISKGRWASKRYMNLASNLFKTVGLVVELPENKINAVTALSGSGPAYVFYLSEAMEKAGEKIGLSKEVSKSLTYQTILGSGKMLNSLSVSSSELRKRVTSPGGTTEAAIKHLEKNKFLNIFIKAVQEARNRAFKLSD
ncbi:MAG: pyrroline-5-carboxylate reductase [Endomicrobiales bacterium]|nr:pyrroline-5-carboxylate reductase [Endomicrobiales bacterium]